jgi:hypothetical protein
MISSKSSHWTAVNLLGLLAATHALSIPDAQAMGRGPRPTPTPSPTQTPEGYRFNAETADRAAVRGYRALLARNPDDGGKQNLLSQLLARGEGAWRDFIAGAIGSPEFANGIRPRLSNEDLLKSFYRNFLDRDPDSSGSGTYLPMIARGQVAEVALALGTSAEFFAKLNQPIPEPVVATPPTPGIQPVEFGAIRAPKWVVLEWSLENPSFSGNPFDLEARAVFTHEGGEQRRTEMFYSGGSTWKFRFIGTQEGTYRFTTESSDGDLNGRSGSIEVTPAPAGQTGFLQAVGDKWVLEGRGDRAIAPQYIMSASIPDVNTNPAKLDQILDMFVQQDGFNGIHFQVGCAWIHVGSELCDRITNDSRPDPRAFEVVEQMLIKTRALGGVVHIWMWGDDQFGRTPKARVGLHSAVDRRIQRYVAARLGAIPNWSMGYGYDVWEWATDSDARRWRDHMRSRLGWMHALGARGKYMDRLSQISEAMDFASYEDHRPSYGLYVEAFNRRPGRPVFFEDRFRINQGPNWAYKDYTYDMTRRGLWHSVMSGGSAAIWGNIQQIFTGYSLPYPEETRAQVRIFSKFFESRFLIDSVRCNDLVPGSSGSGSPERGICLGSRGSHRYVFYRESTDQVQMDLRPVGQSRRAVAFDTRSEGVEIDLGLIGPEMHTWRAPYPSDWAISVGF